MERARLRKHIGGDGGESTSEEYRKDVEGAVQELLDGLGMEGEIIIASPRNRGAEVT